ncbi:hypothetical protein HPB47_011069 [Ixodes persulcatus]|uniref:Uncharacterized protein n=1 Tax=Ixodes persulcatus TaxID=34615 RepID=A0AC60NXL9_IXOPE|nr:hypothetical protein HPB47_011069 [Ixodes persulcatus]
MQDVPTRWNSEHAMMSRLLELRTAISAELSASDSVENLSSAEWKLMAGLVIPLLECTEITLKEYISEANEVASFAISLLRSLKTRFVDVKMSPLLEPCLDSIQQTVNSLALQARRLAFDESHLSPFSLRARDNGIDTIGKQPFGPFTHFSQTCQKKKRGKPDDITILLAAVSSKQGHSRETLKTSVARNTSLDHG